MPVEFPSTLWTQLRNARDSKSDDASRFAARYRPAIVSFLRQSGFSVEDCEDLAQDVFVRLFSEDILQRADKEKGRFRTLLIAVTKQVMYDALRRRSAQKRGGSARIVSIEQKPEIDGLMGRHVEDAEFDRHWIGNLIALAMKRLTEECKPDGDILKLHLEGKTSQEIGAALGINPSTVRSRVLRCKGKLRRLLDREIREYSSSMKEYHDEAAYLRQLMGS